MSYVRPHYRWSDNDRRFGPFIYARDSRGWRPLAMMLCSGDEEEDHRAGCKFRVSAFGHTLITALPAIIKPWRRKVYPGAAWDDATVARLGRDWYWDTKPREYGFSLAEGFLQIYLGRQTDDSSTEQRWSKFLPWTQWRHVRRSLYGLQGEHYWTDPEDNVPWCKRKTTREQRKAIEDACPSITFAFKDFDGEALTVRTHIEEREWRFGTGWFKWLSWFRSPRVRRYLDLAFSGETGKRKGSWKGGTMGHSIEMLPGELHEAAFRRYCAEHQMVFEG